MENLLNRRNALKSGLATIGGMALAPHFSVGAFSHNNFTIDKQNRLYYSPLAREYFFG